MPSRKPGQTGLSVNEILPGGAWPGCTAAGPDRLHLLRARCPCRIPAAERMKQTKELFA